MTMICKDRDVIFKQKGWGYEQWLANSDLYCGKLLVVHAGLQCSCHYHRLKHETFFIQSGLIKMRVWNEPFDTEYLNEEVYSGPLSSYSEFLMEPGDRLVIPPNTPHQFEGVAAESIIIEISTEHFEEDSYRLIKGD